MEEEGECGSSKGLQLQKKIGKLGYIKMWANVFFSVQIDHCKCAFVSQIRTILSTTTTTVRLLEMLHLVCGAHAVALSLFLTFFDLSVSSLSNLLCVSWIVCLCECVFMGGCLCVCLIVSYALWQFVLLASLFVKVLFIIRKSASGDCLFVSSVCANVYYHDWRLE